MSCNILYSKNKKIENVVADNGNESLLYKDALKEFGADQALKIYLASKSDDFQDNIILSQNELDVNNEPKLKIVLNYLSLQNESKEPLTTQQKLDLRNISLGIENFSVQKLIEAFYSDGIFNISPKKLKKSGLYSDYEISNLANDSNLQEKVKQSLEALKNTEEVELDTEFVEGLEKTDEVNSFGKLVNLNPNLVQKEILNKLAATTEQEFENNLADLEYSNFQKKLEKPVNKTLIQKVVDQLKKNTLANKVFVYTNAQIEQKLKEIGISEEVAKQVVAYHGSPYSFDRFTTNAMGTGEGAQAFGWGLYFTDLESIARNYANTLAKVTLKGETKGYSSSEIKDAISVVELSGSKQKSVENLQNIIEETKIALQENPNNIFKKKGLDANIRLLEVLKNLDIVVDRNLYKVSLHKGKTTSEYTWLEWDKPLTTEQKNLIKEKALKSEKLKNSKGFIEYELTEKSVFTGNDIYASLMRKLGSDKEASLFLLRAGIDGIKYPAESISRGATSDTARGFNYVVFDENAITIEEQIQFQKDFTLTPSGFVYKEDVYLNEDKMKLDTPVHEFGHLYLNWLKSNKGDIYQRGLQLAQSKDAQEYIDYVEKTQPQLIGESKLNEILSQAIGDNGAKLADKSWIEDLWDEIKKLFGLSQYTNEQVQNMNLKQFTKAIAVDLYKNQLFQEMQGYKKAEVFMEVDGEIVQAKNTNTAVILPLVAKQINNVEILLDINQIQQYDLEILQANQEDTVRILKGIEDNLIEQGIDVAGLSDREINVDLMSFLGNLEIFINEPTVENTQAFADVYDAYFEKDLSPKTEIIKAKETDRDFVKLNTNLSEEQVYEQQGLIKVKDGLYIRTNKQDLDTLYTNLETYKDKYPKDITLREHVQTQVSQLEDFKNSDNAEAVYLYKMYFNIENNKNGIEQVSQTEKQRSNRGGEIATDASNFLRGKSSTNEKNSSDRQKSELESFAKQRGYWIDNYKKIGEYIGKGMESEVFLSKGGSIVFKVNDLEFYNTPLDYLNTIDEHNNLFPEAPYKLIGFTRRTDTNNFSFILEQPFIEAVRGATQEEVNQELDKLGFNKSISELIFTKDNVEVLDLHEGNVVVDEKGLVYFIDPVIFVTEQQKEEIQPVKKVAPTKKNTNFTGNFEYLTTDFVSDFYIEMLKEREKNSEIYKNFYSNFDINENGIYLKNDDSITMSQIKEYTNENLKQYSIISKQMPLLVEQEIQSETKQVRRDNVLNNPQNLEKYQGQFHKLNDNNIILKNSGEEFIKVEGNIFEAIDSDGNLTLYSRLNNVVGEYYNFNNEAPKSSVKIEDYSYLNTQPDSFMSEKKYLSKSEKEKINQENFDCI